MRTQYQVQNETQIRKNQKDIKNDNDELKIKNYPENKQRITQKRKINLSSCPSCKRNIWLEFDKGYFCQNCEYSINRQEHQIDKKVRRQDHYFSTGLPYADKKTREVWINKVNTTYNTTEDLIIMLQQLNCKTKLKFYKNKSNYYDEVNIRIIVFEEDPFHKKAQSIGKIYHEVILLVKCLQTEHQVRNMNIKY